MAVESEAVAEATVFMLHVLGQGEVKSVFLFFGVFLPCPCLFASDYFYGVTGWASEAIESPDGNGLNGWTDWMENGILLYCMRLWLVLFSCSSAAMALPLSNFALIL
jgi:hypothetical protein